MLGLLLGIALALPASQSGARLELDASGQLDVRSMSASPFTATAPKPPDGSWLGGSGGLGVTVFARPVVDDDAAPPLQPFLQRATRFRLAAEIGGASIRYPVLAFNPIDYSAPLEDYEASIQSGYAEASADGYVAGNLYLRGSVGLAYETWGPAGIFGAVPNYENGVGSPLAVHLDSNELRIHAATAVGWRWRNVLVSAGWQVTPYRLYTRPPYATRDDNQMQVRFWGGAFVDARAVVRRRVEVGVRVEVLDGGARAAGDATVWLYRRLGISAGLEGGHGAFADSPTAYDRAGGRVGVAWWLSPRLAATLAYAPAWQRTTPVAGYGTALDFVSYPAHLFTLTVTSRPPLRHW